MKGVGRNPKGDGREVHMLTDVHADTAVFAKISEAKMHDKRFLQHLTPIKRKHAGLRQGLYYYMQFAQWTDEEVYFVCPLKSNAKYEIQEVLFEKSLEKDEYGVYRVEHIHLKYKKDKKEKGLCLRLVYYRDEEGRKYKFITNNWDITAEEVALTYKYRWTIETTFKKLKRVLL